MGPDAAEIRDLKSETADHSSDGSQLLVTHKQEIF
jgi:hypothetical protein